MEELRTLVIYDIVEDRIRVKVANVCQDFGLERIQYSAFYGRLNRNKREELFLRLRATLGTDYGKFLIQAICEKDAGSQLLYERDRPHEKDAGE